MNFKKQKLRLTGAVLAAVALFVEGTALAASGQTSGAEGYAAPTLGTSTNLAPGSYGGLTSVPSALPAEVQMGPNGTVLPYATERQTQRLALGENMTAPPAWAQGEYRTATSLRLEPFASNLFEGRFASTFSDAVSSDYVLAPGDRIVIRIWGVRAYDDVLVVDQQGNIFIPEVGPVHVAGIRHGQLLSTVRAAIARVYTKNVQVYVNLQSAQPVAVYVTGFVNHPGRYAGGSVDSVMSFIDRAGGIDPVRGSYRHVEIVRNGRSIVKLDLYRFALMGEVPRIRLQDGDVLLVREKGVSVSAYGLLREEAQYEFTRPEVAKGSGLIELSSPLQNVSHVSVSGTRNQAPFNRYFSLEEFKDFRLADGDIVEFIADRRGDTIMVTVAGAITGASRYPVKKNVRLRELLRQVEVESELAATDVVYLRRKSVARDQKAVIQDSLRRLEKAALTATSSMSEEAQIRVEEAKLIQDFVKRASLLEPDGVIVVSRRGQVQDIWLEDGDEVIIPQKSNVVQVTGEVVMPKSIAFEKGMNLDDYLAGAGGVSDRADEKHILVARQNGEVGLVEYMGVSAGDRILVLPKVDSKNILLAKDLMQIVYQIAVATKIAIDI